MEYKIKLTSEPIIDYSGIDAVAEEVKLDLEKVNVDALVATEDNLAFLKKLRAEKNKQFAELEGVRKEIKSLVTKPYDIFENEYKIKIKSLFENFDSILQKKIVAVENGIKEDKKNKLIELFESLSTPEISFLSFDDIGLKIGISDSMKSLKTQVEAFVTKTLDDYNLIMMQENPERILLKYKQTRNVSQAITSVMNEIKEEAYLKNLVKEEIKATIPEPVSIPESVESNEEVILRTVSFKVTGTLEQLRNLKRFLAESGMKYE